MKKTLSSSEKQVLDNAQKLFDVVIAYSKEKDMLVVVSRFGTKIVQ